MSVFDSLWSDALHINICVDGVDGDATRLHQQVTAWQTIIQGVPFILCVLVVLINNREAEYLDRVKQGKHRLWQNRQNILFCARGVKGTPGVFKHRVPTKTTSPGFRSYKMDLKSAIWALKSNSYFCYSLFYKWCSSEIFRYFWPQKHICWDRSMKVW